MSLDHYSILELSHSDLAPDLLKHFNRHQEVRRCFRQENGEWVLKDIDAFTEQWDEALREEIVRLDFTNCINAGGIVWAVYDSRNQVIAFASLLPELFGSSKQYLQLMQIHVSYEHRSKGIGKKLFERCADKARVMGARKLYISAHSSEESQLFYTKVGCFDASEINRKIAEYEPFDRQMEYVL